MAIKNKPLLVGPYNLLKNIEHPVIIELRSTDQRLINYMKQQNRSMYTRTRLLLPNGSCAVAYIGQIDFHGTVVPPSFGDSCFLGEYYSTSNYKRRTTVSKMITHDRQNNIAIDAIFCCKTGECLYEYKARK